jgi:Ca2+-binding EF-hand superfamily protein
MFQFYDYNDEGYVTLMEFRQVFRKLRMGLTLNELDQLCNMVKCEPDGRIEWKQTLKKIMHNNAGNKVIARSHQLL